jgi:hypothetical protein
MKNQQEIKFKEYTSEEIDSNTLHKQINRKTLKEFPSLEDIIFKNKPAKKRSDTIKFIKNKKFKII